MNSIEWVIYLGEDNDKFKRFEKYTYTEVYGLFVVYDKFGKSICVIMEDYLKNNFENLEKYREKKIGEIINGF